MTCKYNVTVHSTTCSYVCIVNWQNVIILKSYGLPLSNNGHGVGVVLPLKPSKRKWNAGYG